MIKCQDFFNLCKKYNFTFFSGVPDSTFKSWMSFLEKNDKILTNIVTVNECEAVAVCAGFHLATGNIGVVYLQNSGFGKTVNPLTSLCDPAVYSIPILLMIGWRGEPGVKDAYQHHKMGPMTIPLLKDLEIPYEIIPDDINDLDKTLKNAKDFMNEHKKPFALVIRKNVFEKLEDEIEVDSEKPSREDAIKTIINNLDGNEIIVSTTGKTSRELFENRVENHSKDFYNIGAMGCAQSIALGIALNKKDKKVFVLDGDGSILMQMGALATTGHYCPNNFYHIVFDNQAHDSTGGQPTCSDTVRFKKVAEACNYKSAIVVKDLESLKNSIQTFK
ncbi:MAG: phosphonopyruvate decarboxylase [Thermoplasmatales archaeon]|nr:MAG: phosphonopyruvate decarboxylase [Thermoplasmatales archaeon]